MARKNARCAPGKKPVQWKKSRRSILSKLETFYNENIDLVSYGWIKRYTASFSKENRIARVYVPESSAANPLKEYGAPTCLFPIAEMSDERTVPLFCVFG